MKRSEIQEIPGFRPEGLHPGYGVFVQLLSAHGAASKHWADVHLFRHEDGRLELEAVSPALYQRVRHLLHEEVETIELAGLIVPLLTPFGADGKIARRALVEHLDGLAAAGVRRVLAGGTTGEFFAMTPAERLEVLKLTLEYFPGLVLFQAGGGPLPEAARLTDLHTTARGLSTAGDQR